MSNIDVEYIKALPAEGSTPTAFKTYSVKFICGELTTTDPIVSSIYRTSINVHNASFQPTFLLKKVVIAHREGEQRGQISNIFTEQLGPNEAFYIDCVDIRRLLASSGIPVPPFIEGFVEILVPLTASINVVAAYTSI